MEKFDKSVRPQDDFFGYINNNWIKNNPIPDDKSIWGTFYELRNKSISAVKKIANNLIEIPDSELSHDQRLIKTFFCNAFNFDKSKEAHISTLFDELRKVDGIKNTKQLARYIGASHRSGFAPFWSYYVSLDNNNSEIQALILHQGGLTLPNRDYYLDTDEKMQKIREEYKKYFKLSQKTLGTKINWKNVIKIEKLIAKHSWSDEKLRDVRKNYNHFTVNELSAKFPDFEWLEHFKGLGWSKPNDNIVVEQLRPISKILEIIASNDIGVIKDYLSWRIVDNLFEWVSNESAKVYFEFHEKTINGRPSNPPVWERAILLANNLIIGEALGREYASIHFPESSKKDVLDIVEDIRIAYHKRINKITWMKERTKQKAHKKLDNTKVLIGYPSVWKNLSKLNLKSDNLISNILALSELESDIEIAKVGKKPPKENWLMNAHTVNAYYHPNELVICFPAGILQPPFYDPEASRASNLGGIGSVIGHELTHGFDDQGAEFDEHGNTKKWVTTAEQKSFRNMAKNIIAQADNFEAAPGLFLNGKLILGEAIADIGGIKLAIEALYSDKQNNIKASLSDLLENYTIAERSSQRKEYLIRQVKTDPHPPSKFRVNCTMSHIDEFYSVYNVKPTDKIYLPPEKRSCIW